MSDFDDVFCFETTHCFLEGKNIKIFSMSYPNNTGEELHSHEYMQIWFVIKGVCNHWVGGNTYELVRGDAFILPPKIVHSTRLKEDTTIICCEFSLQNYLMNQFHPGFNIMPDTLFDLSFLNYFVLDEKKICPKFQLSDDSQDKVKQLLLTMLKEYEIDSLYSDQFLSVYTMQLLLIFAREYNILSNQHEIPPVFSKYKSAVETAIEYIQEHYREPLSLDIVCKHCAVSKTYFCYLFKEITKQTFVEYLMNYRIKKAIILLVNTDLPITKICFNVGFNDLSHFSRSFKSIVGMSARAYRLKKQNGVMETDAPI